MQICPKYRLLIVIFEIVDAGYSSKLLCKAEKKIKKLGVLATNERCSVFGLVVIVTARNS